MWKLHKIPFAQSHPLCSPPKSCEIDNIDTKLRLHTFMLHKPIQYRYMETRRIKLKALYAGLKKEKKMT